MAKRVKCVRCPTDELSLRNVVVVSQADFDENKQEHIVVADPQRPSVVQYVFRTANHPAVKPGEIAFNRPQRVWGNFSLGQELEVKQHQFNQFSETIASMVLEADFQAKKNMTSEAYDSDHMAREVLMQFNKFPFTVGQMFVFLFSNKKMLQLTVKEIEAIDLKSHKTRAVKMGLGMPNTMVTFEKAPDSTLNLTGKSRGKQQYQSIISPDWDFNKMGIGGLDTQFSAIFRRAFASRVFPPDIIDQLGMKHVRGILLFGPPGTGKTLMARQIGKMLNAREPKIVNGPQILDKYVGESEANVRKLFADAEEEEKRCGPNSGLHIIIFDEIDAICKSRGSVGANTGVHDTVVNQLLSKIDGVDQLNNILVIGMTNRKDMIDEALLRPGRLEVQMEIGLPDEHGRVQILNIHTARMKEHDKLDRAVDINYLASKTKNFSGAELEGLVRAATSSAMNRLIKAANKVELEADAVEKLKVTQDDFEHALAHDIKPAFGSNATIFENYIMNGIFRFDKRIDELLENGKLLTLQAKQSDRSPLITVLLEGPPGCGKTALAAQIAKRSDFPLMKILTPEDMIGFHETAKCLAIKKMFDDAYKSPLSLIIVDDIERLLDYAPIGPRFSNLVLQALLVLLKKPPPSNRRLMIIGTTNHREVLDQLDMLSVFNSVFHVFNITTGEQLVSVLNEMDNCFSPDEIQLVQKEVGKKRMHVGIKRLLGLIEMSLQSEPGKRVQKLMFLLEEDGGLESFAYN